MDRTQVKVQFQLIDISRRDQSGNAPRQQAPGLSLWLGRLVALLLSMLLSGCASQYRGTAQDLAQVPNQWQTASPSAAQSLSWSGFIDAEELEDYLRLALNRNPDLRQQALEMDIARESLWQRRMQFWPTLSASLDATRSGTEINGDSTGIGEDFSLGLNLDYELNIWGQLSDEKRSAGYAYAAALADFEAARRNLIIEVSLAWLDVVEAQQRVQLFEVRLQNLEKNLAIIESGYRSGLNPALEVYLARNDVERERTQLVQQRQVLSDARRDLARALGQYPDNDRTATGIFPDTRPLNAPELPARLLTDRPDIQAAWLRVLQQNAELAIAHKARFPSLTLGARANRFTSEFSELGGADIAWSVGASLLQPLLSAGRLKSAESINRLRLEQTEQFYIETVYRAFQEVESALERQYRLESQLTHTQQASDNALQAEKLAFDQYLRGIAVYTTVLEAQRRAVDAQTQLISLQRQIIENRIVLHSAVVGELDFLPDDQQTATVPGQRPGNR